MIAIFTIDNSTFPYVEPSGNTLNYLYIQSAPLLMFFQGYKVVATWGPAGGQTGMEMGIFPQNQLIGMGGGFSFVNDSPSSPDGGAHVRFQFAPNTFSSAPDFILPDFSTAISGSFNWVSPVGYVEGTIDFVQAVPEPSTFALLAVGIVVIFTQKGKRRRRQL